MSYNVYAVMEHMGSEATADDARELIKLFRREGLSFEEAILLPEDEWQELVDEAVTTPNYQHADLSWSDFNGRKINGARFLYCNLNESGFRAAELNHADFRWSRLQDADLQGADLQGADLRWTDLRGADLRGANLRRAHLTGADLTGADLTGAFIDEEENSEASH